MHDESRIEIATYRLTEGTCNEDFQQVVDAVAADLKNSGSAVGRRLFKGNDGVWVDIVSRHRTGPGPQRSLKKSSVFPMHKKCMP